MADLEREPQILRAAPVQVRSVIMPAQGIRTGYCQAPMRSPAYSCIASRLSWAGYLAAEGPSAKEPNTLAVTWRTKTGRRTGDPVRLVAEGRLHPAHRARVEGTFPAGVGVVGGVAVAADALADQRGVGQHLDRPLNRVAGSHRVVFDPDQIGEGGARGHAGALEHPAARAHHLVGGGERVRLRTGCR